MRNAWIVCLFCCSTFFIRLNGQVAVRAVIESNFTDSLSRFELQKNIHFPVLDSLYRSNNYNPIFHRGLAELYLNHLRESALLGFKPSEYNYEALLDLHQQRSAEAIAAFDLAAIESYLLFLDDVKNGLLKNERTRGEDVHFSLEIIDPILELNRIMELPTMNYLKLAEPASSSYRQSKKILLEIQAKAADFGEDLIWVDSLKIGDKDSSVLALKKRLWVLGDYDEIHRFKSAIFNADVENALQSFQVRHLLPASGILDKQTTALLNRPIREVIDELQLNLDRWRWLPNNLGDYYVFVNIPAFEAELVKNDSLLLKQKMICGKVSRATPSFYSTMTYLDINPTWTVPPTILQKDILPAVQKSSTYLSKKNIQVYDIQEGKYISASEINWANPKKYKYVQGPGLTNALGVVKFIFPNSYFIFLHDTPSKELFNQASRAYSSGCIRLSKPREFAEILLSYNSQPLSLVEIDSVVQTQKTTTISLKEKPVVYIHYLTQEYKDGMLYNYPDVYGYNEKQMAAFKQERQ